VGSVLITREGLASMPQTTRNGVLLCLVGGLVALPGDRLAAQDAAAQSPVVQDYSAHILTPPDPDTPRINGARVFGVRPGSPFLYAIAASGKRPMAFGAENLPAGLSLDAKTGQITGRLTTPGEHRITLRAQNALGAATRELRVVCGDRLALTPPLGWNSWNAGGPFISDEKVRANAKAMVDSGLSRHGWTYINIDDAWQGARGGQHNAIQGNEKFPDMRSLADHVHGLGLKLGIYSTPWTTSYAGYIGGSSDDPEGRWSKEQARDVENRPVRRHGRHSFAWADARQWAEWGIDYLKYDWNPTQSQPSASPSNDIEYLRQMADALRYSGRDIVYSYSNSAPFSHVDEMAVHANAWRNTGDIRDNWHSMSTKGFDKDPWAAFAGPGHWNDPDMLVLGLVGWQGRLASTQLTPDEQYTHISLWSLVASPLLIGCDMARLDPFTISLLRNDEVLAVDQDPLGEQAVTVWKGENPDDPGVEVYVNGRQRRYEMPKLLQVLAKSMEDGSRAAGLFNRSTKPAKVTLDWSSLKIAGRWRVRDLWRQKDLGVFEQAFSAEVAPHGVALVQLFEQK
jgi:alpha-galactosidase